MSEEYLRNITKSIEFNGDLNSKEWGKFKRLIWKHIKEFFDDKLLRSKSLDKIKAEVLNHLTKKFNIINKFIKNKKEYIERAIIAIFLIETKDYKTQNEIVLKSGFKGKWSIREIRKYFKIKLPRALKYQKLDINKEEGLQECSNCHRIISNDLFSGRSRKCNDCRNVKNLIIYFQKKVAVILYLFLKKTRSLDISEYIDLLENQPKNFEIFNACSKCGLSIEHLPTFELHHQNPLLKTIDWSKLRTKPLERVLKMVEKENCLVLCSNCHKIQISNSFNKLKDTILTTKLEEASGLIKRHVLKRDVVIQLSGGYCTKCKSIGLDKLTALQFHHKDPKLKKNNWHSLRHHSDIESVVDILKNEKCIVLCANCHKETESIIFQNYKNEILERYLKFKKKNKEK